VGFVDPFWLPIRKLVDATGGLAQVEGLDRLKL
jgi:hypothetical protein